MYSTPKAKLHFAHANGFPAGSYALLFSQLSNDFDVIALEKFGHNAAFPVSKDWSKQVEELVNYVKSNSTEPVYAVGHSFGAVVSYMAVCEYPELFKGLIMLDPPLITGLTALVARGVKSTPLFDKFTPAKQTLNRCTRWDENTDLVDYFKNKNLFKNMHIQCVQDYVSSATEPSEQGYKLTFSHEVEAEIFRTLPLKIHQFYGKLSKPAVLITGEKTTVCKPKLIAPFIEKNGLEHYEIEGGGHMFPLEQPEKVGQMIAQQIHQWEERSKH